MPRKVPPSLPATNNSPCPEGQPSWCHSPLYIRLSCRNSSNWSQVQIVVFCLFCSAWVSKGINLSVRQSHHPKSTSESRQCYPSKTPLSRLGQCLCHSHWFQSVDRSGDTFRLSLKTPPSFKGPMSKTPLTRRQNHTIKNSKLQNTSPILPSNKKKSSSTNHREGTHPSNDVRPSPRWHHSKLRPTWPSRDPRAVAAVGSAAIEANVSGSGGFGHGGGA